MSAKSIDGRSIAAELEKKVAAEAAELSAAGITPGLAVVLVGDDPASRVYVNSKKKACLRCGIYSEEVKLPATATQAEIMAVIDQLNQRNDIHGILVQLPMPAGIDEHQIINCVHPSKDVDGFHPVNLGRLISDEPMFIPCTPAGVMDLIKSTGVEIKGKECVVVGRSLIVGKPVSFLLLREHGTVTMAHSRTANLAEVCRRADILVVGVGRPNLVTGNMIKPGAVVIDVGTNRVNNSLVGDVNFEEAAAVASYITPVPGGVGPMTIVKLMENTVLAARLTKKQHS